MLGNGTSILYGSLNLQEKLNAFGDVEFMKNVNIRGKLTINGQEVFPGQGEVGITAEEVGMECIHRR